MRQLDKFIFFLKKKPLARAITLVVIIAVIFGISPLVRLLLQRDPSITIIAPEIASSGEVITIAGDHFGAERGERGYVEIAGSRLTSTSYISWKNNKILVKLPLGVKNGLVYVHTGVGQSNPKIFTNKATVPTPIQVDPFTALPFIQIIQERSATVGSIITLQGRNFGNVRNMSQVFFTRSSDDFVDMRDNVVCLASDYDYVAWDDTEIRVRVPDGATTGMIHVETDKGESNSVQFTVSSRLGIKTYSDKRTYLLDSTIDLRNIETRAESTITLRVPRPLVTSSQPSVDLFSTEPNPFIEDFDNTVVYQFIFGKTNNAKKIVKNQFVVSSYAVQTKIQENLVTEFSEKDRPLYIATTQADEVIPSEEKEIVELARSIIGKEKNPYRKARLIFNHLLENSKLSQNLQGNTIDPLDSLKGGTADAYNMAILYTALLRSVGIPTLPVSGILIDKNSKTRSHWWSEFYIEGFGWIPVDIALAAGLEYEAYQSPENPASFYFGNLDAQHIVFSRGLNVLKQTKSETSIMYRPKTYALQSIWEESSADVEQYTSFWSDPSIAGIY